MAQKIHEETCLLAHFTSSLHDLNSQKIIFNFKNSYLIKNISSFDDSQSIGFSSPSSIISIHHMSKNSMVLAQTSMGEKPQLCVPSPQMNFSVLHPPNMNPRAWSTSQATKK